MCVVTFYLSRRKKPVGHKYGKYGTKVNILCSFSRLSVIRQVLFYQVLILYRYSFIIFNMLFSCRVYELTRKAYLFRLSGCKASCGLTKRIHTFWVPATKILYTNNTFNSMTSRQYMCKHSAMNYTSVLKWTDFVARSNC